MSVKERILTIRLMEKLADRKALAEEFGITPVDKFVIFNQQDNGS